MKLRPPECECNLPHCNPTPREGTSWKRHLTMFTSVWTVTYHSKIYTILSNNARTCGALHHLLHYIVMKFSTLITITDNCLYMEDVEQAAWTQLQCCSPMIHIPECTCAAWAQVCTIISSINLLKNILTL